MPSYDAKNATVHVFTEKDGLLSAMAHDLQLEVTDFSVTADDGALNAKFRANSFKVLHGMKDGRPTTALSDKDKADIIANMAKDVLHAAKFPEIAFASTSVKKQEATATVAGTLTLHGVSRPVTAFARREGASWVAEVSLSQLDYGIKPFSAMMGTLKVKPGLRVRVTLPTW